MFDLIAKLLAWFYGLVPSYGLSIVLLTLVVMIIVTPLTLKGTRSMIKMQRLQPEMKKIQTRYKNDRDRMNKEMMAFYQANGINPMGGCLPLFIQAPVFIVLYNVLRGLTRRLSDVGDGVGWAAGRMADGAAVAGVPGVKSPFYPDYIAADSQLFKDLSGETEMVSFGIDLSRSASRALSESTGAALPYVLLILVVFVSSWYQQRQIRGRNPDQSINPQQQMIMKVMPFFLPVISFSLDAALVVYFVASNLYRIAQQSYITRTLYGPGQEAPAVVIPEPLKAEKPEKPAKKPQTGKNSKGGSGSQEQGPRQAGGQGSARSRRTTAGENRNDSQKSTSERQTPPASKARGKGPVKESRRGLFGRRATGTPNEPTDQRPPAPRKGGGRTTPPGTSRPGGSSRKKKKRK